MKSANARVSYSENGASPGYVSEHGFGDVPASNHNIIIYINKYS